jgi:thymidylate kinase
MLVEVEGPSGAGKTTLIDGLCADPTFSTFPVLKAADLVRSGDDTGYWLGAFMRQLGAPLDPVEAVFLYSARTAARARVVGVPLADTQIVVLCDRLRLSLFVQTRLANVDDATARAVVELATRRLSPDLTVLLDVDHESHCRRLAQRGHPAESDTAFDRIRSSFHIAYDHTSGPKLCIDTSRRTADDVRCTVHEHLMLLQRSTR